MHSNKKPSHYFKQFSEGKQGFSLDCSSTLAVSILAKESVSKSFTAVILMHRPSKKGHNLELGRERREVQQNRVFAIKRTRPQAGASVTEIILCRTMI